LNKPRPPMLLSGDTDPSEALIERRLVRFSAGAPVETAIYDRAQLNAGMTFAGPAMIEESGSLTCVPPGVHVLVNPYGHLLLTVEEA
jgi:N-methylhydantoinase A